MEETEHTRLDDVTDPASALNEIFRIAGPRQILGEWAEEDHPVPVRWELVATALRSGTFNFKLKYHDLQMIFAEVDRCPSGTVRAQIRSVLENWVMERRKEAIPDIADEALKLFRSHSYQLQSFLARWPFLRADRELVAEAVSEAITHYGSKTDRLPELCELVGTPEDAIQLHRGLLSRGRHLRVDEHLANLLYDWSGGSEWGQFQYRLWRPEDVPTNGLRSVEGAVGAIVDELKRLPLSLTGAQADIDLLALSPQSRASWRRSLRDAAAQRPGLLEPVIEAVLQLTSNRGDELALFTALELLSPDRLDILECMLKRPMPLVALRANAALDLARGAETAADLVDRTRQAPVEFSPDRPSRTWIGDRAVEEVLHNAFATAARDLADEMRATVDSGEETHVAILFERLRNETRAATRRLATIAQEEGRKDRFEIVLERRIIGKTEEGKEGLAPGHAFSTDVCLLFAARRDGKIFAQRATLIQAKRLLRESPTLDELYTVDMDQMNDIAKQTFASFLLLAGPEVDGVSIPVIPARLLIEHFGTDIGRRTLRPRPAARLGRSLAPWLLSEVVGLWTGDPRSRVIEKAEGSETGRPTTVLELTVSLVPLREEIY